jgi:hypothetical protein
MRGPQCTLNYTEGSGGRSGEVVGRIVPAQYLRERRTLIDVALGR